LTPEAEHALIRSAEHAAGALSDAGYFGPFGVDAYFWRTGSGALRFNPLGELNARYTMGFSVGMSPADGTAADGTAAAGTAPAYTPAPRDVT